MLNPLHQTKQNQKPCAPGSYWNETTQTTACLSCPTNTTSLQGATQCFTPCASNEALDTTTLTCVAVPQAATDALVEQGIDPATVTDNFVVSQSTALEDTIGYLSTLPPGSVVVVALEPGVYPTFPADLEVDLIIVGLEERRRRLETEGRRHLQTGFTVITAADNGRHFSTTRLLSLSRVILQGSPNSAVISGGVQLTVRFVAFVGVLGDGDNDGMYVY